MSFWPSWSAQHAFAWTRKKTRKILNMAHEHNPLSARQQEFLRSLPSRCARDLRELKDTGQRRREEVVRMLKAEVKQRLEQRKGRAAAKKANRAAVAHGCACGGQCRGLCPCYVRGLLEISTYIGIIAAILLTVKLLKE